MRFVRYLKSTGCRLFYRFALAAVAGLLLSPAAQAGFIEVGGAASYKRSNIDVHSFDESQSITGSLSYYFDESSALELSYTDGTNRRIVGDGQPTGSVTNMYYRMMGLDFVLTIGTQDAVLRPYFKAGGVYILEKRIQMQYRNAGIVFDPSEVKDDPALVPSAGVGFKLALTKSWSLKVGVDAWTSRPLSEDNVTVDYAGRVGLSFIF